MLSDESTQIGPWQRADACLFDRATTLRMYLLLQGYACVTTWGWPSFKSFDLSSGVFT
jgi:hypothetical protein